TFDTPILLDDRLPSPLGRRAGDEGESSTHSDINIYEHIAEESGFTTLDKLTQQFLKEQVSEIQTVTLQGESTDQALERIAQSAVEAVRNGSRLIVLNDADAFLE